MLINLTNHPVHTWSEKQLNAAEEKWGYVKDYPFPEVNPDSAGTEVIDNAKKILRDLKIDKETAVLCQGEMTLTLVMVQLLQKEGVAVYAVTSQRVANEKQSGTKVVKSSTYEFVCFREYPNLNSI